MTEWIPMTPEQAARIRKMRTTKGPGHLVLGTEACAGYVVDGETRKVINIRAGYQVGRET